MQMQLRPPHVFQRCAVPPLADLQDGLRRALVMNDAADVAMHLTGGADPKLRLAIHRRHYETSLVTALLGKFPATTWLVGSPFVADAARDFARDHPPRTPCIAEYGREFPGFLSARPAADRVSCLQTFAELEWHIGQVAIAVDRPALPLAAISKLDGDTLTDSALTVQPGLRYCSSSWPIGDLMKLYLTEAAPDRFSFEPGESWLEIRGARGDFQLVQLPPDEFAFRNALREGASIGAAAEQAFQSNMSFDPGQSLVRLIRDGLAVALHQPIPRGTS